MTIAIGGWGSRRKPMSIVRAIVRSDLDDLTIVTYGGPDLGLLCAAGKVRQAVVRLRVARLDPARAALPGGPPDRRHRGRAARRGPVPPRAPGRGMAGAVPAHPGRPRLGPAARQPAAHDGHVARTRSRRRRARSWSPCRPSASTPRICHLNVADGGATPCSSGPTSTWTTSCCRPRRPAPVHLGREGGRHRRPRRRERHPPPAADQPDDGRRRGRGPGRRPLHARATPTTSATRRSRRRTPASAKSPEAWAEFRAEWVDIPEDEYQRKVREAAA